MKKREILIALVIVLFAFIPLKANAASLKIGLDQSIVEPDKEFNVGIYLEGITTAVNQLSLNVTYDASKITYVNTFSSHGTPKAQNTNGNVTIELNGEKLTEGQALNIHFKPKDTATDGTSDLKITAKVNGLTETLTASETLTHGTEIEETTPSNPIPQVTNQLKSLFVTGCSLNPVFSPTVLNYTCKNPSNASVTINATASDSSHQVTGNGVHSLNPGKNVIEVNVKGKDASTTTYKITVISEETSTEPSTKLKSITFNNKEIKITDKLTYLVGVPEDAKTVNFQTKTATANANVKVEGNENIKPGINIVTITVSAKDLDDTVYTILVYKPESSVITYLEGLDILNSNLIYEMPFNPFIPSSIFELLKDNKYTITYNSVNQSGGLLYSLSFNKDVQYSNDYVINFVKANEIPLTYASTVPENVDIKLFVDPEEVFATNLYLYSFDQATNEYTLINDNLEVKDHYVSFSSTGARTYVLSETALTKKVVATPVKKNNDNLMRIIFLVIGILLGVVGTLFGPKLLKKKAKPVVINQNIERL